MEIRSIPAPILKAAGDILTPFVPELTPIGLVRAIRDFEPGEPIPLEPWWTTKKAAKFLTESHYTVIRRLKAGTLRGQKVGGKYLVDPASVRELLGIQEPQGEQANV